MEQLEHRALEIRRDILRMLHEAGSGHPGGSLSMVEILTALFFQVMNKDPDNPRWEKRDRFVLSKGHGVPALYAALAHAGYFPRE
ncbi:MAG: transketolase, partial [bacterium]